VYDNLNIGC